MRSMANFCDVLIVGSGAAGLSAAVTAAGAGLRVILVEKQPLVGGTTALSEGMIWVPCSPQSRALDLVDSPEAAFEYLQDVCGLHLDAPRAKEYLRAAPKMLKRLAELDAATFYVAAGSIDYFMHARGATEARRSLCPSPFDARLLGTWFNKLQRPLNSTLLFGGMTVASGDYGDYLRVGRSWGSTLRVANWTGRYLLDRMSGAPRGRRIANGNALIARLLQAAIRLGVDIRLNAPATRLLQDDGRVSGAEIVQDSEAIEIRARRGVVLATGGISGDLALAAAHFPDVARGQTHLRLVAEGVAGDGWSMARPLNADQGGPLTQPCAWAPASRVPGEVAECFPHFIERAKPGVIVVNTRGERFANEADTYHVFTRALVDACADAKDATAFIIADRRALRKYGLGAAPPSPALISPFLKSGYLVEASSIQGLAQKLGVDPDRLAATVERFNGHSVNGDDPDFGRGRSQQNRHYGDPAHGPNSCLGPIETPPFYAIQIHPSDIGGFVGLRTDARARVLDERGVAIDGLYAAGNDAATLFGGAYPAGGATIGPAMTFGYLAAMDLAGARDSDDRAEAPVQLSRTAS